MSPFSVSIFRATESHPNQTFMLVINVMMSHVSKAHNPFPLLDQSASSSRQRRLRVQVASSEVASQVGVSERSLRLSSAPPAETVRPTGRRSDGSGQSERDLKKPRLVALVGGAGSTHPNGGW